MVDAAIAELVTAVPRELAGVVVLFSGGNDSTVLGHLMRERATHVGHCNTTIGIEATRQYVRDTSAAWGLPLIETYPPQTYEELVVERGFPGPAQHWKMYQRLKDRGLCQIRRQLVSNGRRQRVVFLSGMRRAESARRMRNVEDYHHDRATGAVFVAPLGHWTDDDMAAYRAAHGDVPRNEVSDHLHMSGECLCGAYAAPGELAQLDLFYPEVADDIRRIELRVAEAGHPEPLCRWGWGGDYEALRAFKRARRTGLLCTSCDARYEATP